ERNCIHGYFFMVRTPELGGLAESTVFFAGAGRVKPELPRRRAKVHVFLRKSGKTRERRAKVHVFPRQKREIVEIAKFTFTIAGLLPILAKNALKTCTFAGLFAGAGRVKPELPRRRAKVHVFSRQKRKIAEIAKFTCTFAGLLPILAKIALKTCTFAGLFAGADAQSRSCLEDEQKCMSFCGNPGKLEKDEQKCMSFPAKNEKSPKSQNLPAQLLVFCRF
ncbi:hypothetical protein, partial [Paenibacillus residui]